MLVYEYKCDSCEYEFSVKQRITEEPIHDCPKCKEREKVRRLISKSSFILKGDGWAKDGYTSNTKEKGK